jgi:hypothetical protein
MDMELTQKLVAVRQFAVLNNKAPTYALQRETIDAMLSLCALVAMAAGADDCGYCEGCVVVAQLRKVMVAELRKNMS